MHRWTGLILAAVGILVFFSGAFLVFHHELSDWAQRGNYHQPIQAISAFNLDDAYRIAAQEVPLERRCQVVISQNGGEPLTFQFRGETGENAKFTVVRLNPENLNVEYRATKNAEDGVPPPVEASFVRFFLNLHIFLLMPRTLGLIATGIAGFALLVLIVSGFWVYRPTWRKLKTPPKGAPRRFFGQLHAWTGI